MFRGRGGEFKVALAKYWFGDVSVLEVKAFAMRHSLEFVAELGLRWIEVESDSSGLVSILNSRFFRLSYVGSLCEDIRSLVVN